MRKTTKARNIGIEIDAPKEICHDKKCPFHGSLPLRGRTISGTMVSKDVHNTAIVETRRKRFISKFERYELRKTRLATHNPPCIQANIGDQVMIAESRPMSKTKKFVIIKAFGEDIKFREREESRRIDIESQKTSPEKKEE